MCKDVICSNNIIYDSTGNGIIVSLPSHNIKINNNSIRNCASGSILVWPQMEHGEYDSTDHNIEICHNLIKDGNHIGIELNNADNVMVVNNRIYDSVSHGVYLLTSTNIKVHENECYKNKRGIVLEQSSDSNEITSNKIHSIHPMYNDHGVFVLNSENNLVKNNVFYGKYESITKEFFEEHVDENHGTNTFENNNIDMNSDMPHFYS
jgi:parallel beta-helix repeat protein